MHGYCQVGRVKLSFEPLQLVFSLNTLVFRIITLEVAILFFKPLKIYHLQSRTKVLGTVLQYSYFSVISRFPHKTVQPFRNFLTVLPPPTLYKVETRTKFWIHACNIVCGVGGGVGPLSKTFVHDCGSFSRFRAHYVCYG